MSVLKDSILKMAAELKIRKPEVLVMRPNTCFYCTDAATRMMNIALHEGILACDQHESDAVRDCQAYLHTKQIARICDAELVPALAALLAAIPSSFSIRRSSGAIEANWSVLRDPFTPNYFSKVGSTWTFQGCIVLENGDRLRRAIELSMFMDEELRIPSLTDALITDAVAALDAGVYREAYERQQGLIDNGNSVSSVTDAPDSSIVSVVINGVACRIAL